MSYIPPKESQWQGRQTDDVQYVHQLVKCVDIAVLKEVTSPFVALLGYGVDEGVRRNSGRVGAAKGPDAFREAFSKLSIPGGKRGNHLVDFGTLVCNQENLEATQDSLSERVCDILHAKGFPILIGGGHDIAYGHYKGIEKFLADSSVKIGIVNFDAHLDLRDDTNGANSGTPFYQISKEVEHFHYLCVGFRESSNSPELKERASQLGVQLIPRKHCHLSHRETCEQTLKKFIDSVDVVYLTVDLDGFADAYAPGVSASSPLGFDVDFAIWGIERIIQSNKLISVDIAELNPTYDIDQRTAKLAAGIVHFILSNKA
jgi:formiminoglutamase